jgi:hypothetical protein
VICMRTVIILAAAVGALLAASPGGAQSLADAARRAEEQHQQAGAGTPSFTDRDLTAAGGLVEGNREAMSLTLTLPRLQQYAGARTAMLRAMVQSPDLTRQIRSAVGRGARRGVDGLEQEYATIPAVVNAMQASQMSVHDYAVTEVAFTAAVGVLAGKLPLAGAPGTVGANVDFLKSHQQEVERLWRDATPLEQSLARQ